jgi:hypothetical protein
VRRFAHPFALVLVLALLVGCNSPISKSDSTASSNVTPTSPAIRLRPPDFTLKGKTSTQSAIQGAYYWQLENGLAVDVKSGGFSTSGVTPMNVSQNEQLTITLANGGYPDKLDMKIYKQDGNLVDVPVATAGVKAFEVKTAPIDEQSFTNTPYLLTVNIPPGDYFIWLSGTWTNPFKRPAVTATSSATPAPVKPLTDQVAFWIQVQ